MILRGAVLACITLVGCADDAAGGAADSLASSDGPSVGSTSTSSADVSSEAAGSIGDTTTTTGDGNQGSSTGDEVVCLGRWRSPPTVRTAQWVAPAVELAHPWGFAVAAGGEFVAAHSSPSDARADDADAYVVKYDIDGEPIWIDRYAGMGLEDQPLGVVVDDLGRPYAVVRENLSEIHAEDVTYVDSRIVVLAFEADGDHRWRWELESEPENPRWWNDQRDAGIRIDQDGHLHVAVTGDINLGGWPLTLLELDEWGNLEDSASYEGPWGWEYGRITFALAPDGSPRVLVGQQFGPTAGGQIYVREGDAMVQLAAYGGERRLAAAIAVGPDAEMIVVGPGRAEDGADQGFMRGFAADGAATIVTDGMELPVVPYAVTVDCDGTIVLAGSDFDVIRIVALDPEGAVLWNETLEPTVETDSVYAWHVEIAPDSTALAAAGWSDLAPDNLGQSPWFAVLTPN